MVTMWAVMKKGLGLAIVIVGTLGDLANAGWVNY